MSQINVLVATSSPALKAKIIAQSVTESVIARADMNLIESNYVAVDKVDTVLESIPFPTQCALVLIGRSSETNELAEQWLAAREDLVVMRVDVVDDIVRIGLRNPSLDSLMDALRELVERVGSQRRDRVVSIQLRSVGTTVEDSPQPPEEATQRPLLEASIEWVHALLQNAVEETSDEVNGLTVTRKTLLESLDAPSERPLNNNQDRLLAAEKALDSALATVDTNTEPLATAARVFGLGPIEFRMMVLTLAPELNIRFQRCNGFLLDEIGRRVGTLGLNSSLLGLTPQVRGELINGGALAHWLVFEGYVGRLAAADEPLRLDPFLADWLLGDDQALKHDPRVRRVLRLVRWPGACILEDQDQRAATLIENLLGGSAPRWVLLDGDDPAAWRALIERGTDGKALIERGADPETLIERCAEGKQVEPIRVEPTRLAGVDLNEVEECARRIGRMARLTGDPLVIDITKAEGSDAEDDYLRLFLATLDLTRCRAAVICRDEARIVQLLGAVLFELEAEQALPKDARIEAVRAAALGAGAYLTQESAESIANRYPLHVDGLEQAMLLAARRPKNYDDDDPGLDRFVSALKELASERISHLVERIEPVFSLEEVVLPPDRKQQLIEIVDQIRFASKVLDGWKFRRQLPYGRGVAALFSGPSGTGKTMASMGIARRLGIQILRLDLSRVVSKYIGETEKNLDRVFTDAQGSGAAILIDEADALLGKRSEVKDAHDRYANIEVAYLLQRLEAYEGLAILTTNMRKNLDAAFLRRLRFIVDFPRPDADAREKIWRQCLPDESHELGAADFRQLARRVDLTGGQIRQVTLRAAFIAAAAGKQIGLEHIAQAVSAEFAKLGMPPIEIDLLQARRAAA